jgi:hypothetical protein
MKRDTRSSDSNKASAEKASADKLKAVLKKVEADPADEKAWDELEAATAESQKPDDAAAAYRAAFRPDMKPEQIAVLGQRALRFHEEWYAGETAVIVDLLETILKLDPSADWALERLTILRSVSQQWDELLAAYDRVLSGLGDGARRHRLLRDAASVARDSSNVARAASYLLALFEATPGNVEVSSDLERLLERQSDYATLAKVRTRSSSAPASPAATSSGSGSRPRRSTSSRGSSPRPCSRTTARQ